MKRIAASLVLVSFLFLSCRETPTPPPPHAAPAVDSLARTLLRSIAAGDLDGVRQRLSSEGRESVTSLSMAHTFGYFQNGPPKSVTLLDAEIADSRAPTPAERHRLTYRLETANDSSYYYFFELMVENGDSAITGFRIEPGETALAR